MEEIRTERSTNRQLAKIGLDYKRFLILDALDDDDEGWVLDELSEVAGLSPEKTLDVLKALALAGFVTQTNGQNRRLRRFKLTPSGTEKAEQGRKLLGFERMRDLFDEIDAYVGVGVGADESGVTLQ